MAGLQANAYRYRTGARRKAGVFRIALPASGRLDGAVYLLGAVLAPVTGGLGT